MNIFRDLFGRLAGRADQLTTKRPVRRFSPLGETLNPRISLSQIVLGATSRLISPPTNRPPAMISLQASSFKVTYAAPESTTKPAIKDQVNVQLDAIRIKPDSGTTAKAAIKDHVKVQLDAMTTIPASGTTAKAAIKDQVNVQLGALVANPTSRVLASSQIKDQINIELTAVKVSPADGSLHVQGVQSSTTVIISPGGIH